MPKLKIKNDYFEYDGEKMQIISGAVHYFRILPQYWKDRLQKLKACGFNTVETYVPWNIHEPELGDFNFSGFCDLEKFLETADKLGLYVIIRPSPYICAEWEFGGLPAWLLEDSDLRLRCHNKKFMDKVEDYFSELMPRLRPYLSTAGGPIIALQIENEYGSYGNDKQYLKELKQIIKNKGIDVLLFTSDGPTDIMLNGGSLENVFKTVNFGSNPEQNFQKLLQYQDNKPLMCMEFWNGWFDHWDEEHHTREAEEVAEILDKMLTMGASVNFYMFSGGTNFGFYNGANHDGKFKPTTTNYDYDAPVSESGEMTEKYFKIRKVISKHFGSPEVEIPEKVKKKDYGTVNLQEKLHLFDSLSELSEPINKVTPEPMEKLGQNYGFILYRTTIENELGKIQLHLQDVHDRALVFLDQNYIGKVYRNDKEQILQVDIARPNMQLNILVENMGRINYGPSLRDYKGITHGVRLGRQFLFDWQIYCLPLKDLSKLSFNCSSAEGFPAFYKGNFSIADKQDTFIDTEGWKKGIVFVNGFNLGRYWEIGPPQRLYLPAPLLEEGENELILFELHEVEDNKVKLVDNMKYN